MSEKMVRMSFTVPPQFRDELDYISSRLGVSKSSALQSLLGDPLSKVADLLRQVPEEGAPFPRDSDVSRRFRDSSITYITDAAQRVSELLKD